MTAITSFLTIKGLDLLAYGLLLNTLYYVGLVVWRLFFHPLSKFPGPRLAAATRWYEFYHDVVLGGVTPKSWPGLHKRYGPIIRTAPETLHINAPEFYQEVFSWHSEYYKAPYHYDSVGMSSSIVSICDPKKHKIHRSVVAPLFAQQSIDKLAPSVADKVGDAVEVMKQCCAQGKPTDIQLLYRCITIDIITKSLFGFSQNLVGSYDGDKPLMDSLDLFTTSLELMKHFQILQKAALKLPSFLSDKVLPGYSSFRDDCAKWISSIQARREKGFLQNDDGTTTIFDLMLESDPKKGYDFPSLEQLVDDAFLFLVAGSDTTAYTLSVATFHILEHNDVLARLRSELTEAPRDNHGTFIWKDLANLPYLTAVIKESLRLASPVPGVLPRIVPPGGTYVRDKFIPGGTIVNSSIYTIYTNPDLFESPEKFIPERWLGEKGKQLEPWNVGFSKGSRNCIGQSLAYLEMRICLATFLTRFDLELYETDRSSMEWLDKIVAQNASNAKVLAKPILLVPTTEILLTSRDRESGSLYSELAFHEDFLESHVLRIRNGAATSSGSEGGTVRDNRGKALQFTTLNGRTVVVKDAFVYSNKGFKTLNQAQILNDALYYPDALDAQQWLIYYISRPLVGSFEIVNIIPAALPDYTSGAKGPSRRKVADTEGGPPAPPRKKDIKSFNDLLNNFPMIARQMQPGLARLFKEFQRDFEKPLPTASLRSSKSTAPGREDMSPISRANSHDNPRHGMLNGHAKSPSTSGEYNDDELTTMRRALESAVTAAIDLFQLVDKQQLSLLGATTDLTGPVVERLIERYITEQVHDSILFPKICKSTRSDDLELDTRIRQMESVDITQVGIAIEGGRQGKEELMQRLSRAVEEFRKLGVAGSPQEMLDILLATEKTVTSAAPTNPQKEYPTEGSEFSLTSEKPSPIMTINADTLVSLLLVVVIRSQVRHLQARLSYMRHFIFIDDVEGGEVGYALSTFEAVLSYLAKDSGGLRKASRRNKRLWQATRNGNVSEMRAILEPEKGEITDEDALLDSEHDGETLVEEPETIAVETVLVTSMNGSVYPQHTPTETQHLRTPREEPSLAHVFPFQTPTTSPFAMQNVPRKDKRVSVDMRSLSGSSEFSVKSGHTTIDSRSSGIEGDTSIDKLSKTQDSAGDSVLMMAVEARQPAALKYLLTLSDYYPVQAILDDSNSEGTTLLSAAVQLAHTELIEIILDFVFRAEEDRIVIDYFAKQDLMGRTVAHYLFNAPGLISKIGRLLPWRRKDKNGQTPLFALCRSYDHPQYSDMVDDALDVATQTQGDGQDLQVDDHVDNKGNTLLHVVTEPQLTLWILQRCDSDVNATNDKGFTPLMVASKYGRVDMVRALFGDLRVDLYAKELRGMTAVELAKDDDVRNRIDDLVLFSNPPAADGRITTVVRSFFVEDATIRLVLKSGAPNANATVTVTTCRRALSDFENLARWLAREHPASWLPSISSFRSPFQITSKPARSVLFDIQVRLDSFLKVLLSHSTFSTHETLWEFFLVPEVQPAMMAERSEKKAEIRVEKVKEEYEPVDDVKDVELFVGHATETVRGVNHLTKSVIRRVNKIRNTSSDLSDAQQLSCRALSTLTFLAEGHVTAFSRYSTTLRPLESDPHKLFLSDMHSISSTIIAILFALARPQSLITLMSATSKAIDRHTSSLRRSDRWPLGLLDDTRNKYHLEAADKVEKSKEELRALGSELRYTQQTVASELAGWQDLHEKMGRRAIRTLAQRMVVREKDRLDGMKRAVRGLSGLVGRSKSGQGT